MHSYIFSIAQLFFSSERIVRTLLALFSWLAAIALALMHDHGEFKMQLKDANVKCPKSQGHLCNLLSNT
jgi:hypothetical protein